MPRGCRNAPVFPFFPPFCWSRIRFTTQMFLLNLDDCLKKEGFIVMTSLIGLDSCIFGKSIPQCSRFSVRFYIPRSTKAGK